jgi:hypothetical protein
LGHGVGAVSPGMALSRHGGQRRAASGDTGDLRPRSWARNGLIGLTAFGLELGKEMEGKEKRKVARLGIRPRRDSENSKGFPFSNLFTNIKLIWIQFKFEF